MNDLAVIHGVTINRNCVTSGFDWRSGELNPVLSDTFNNIFLKPRNLKLAQNVLMTDYKAGRLFPRNPIPVGIRALMASVNESSVLPPSANGSSTTSDEVMTPDSVESIFAIRNVQALEKGTLRKRRQADEQLGPKGPADCKVHQQYMKLTI
jgi:hypothetical protein